MKYLFLALILFGSFFASGIEAACTETDGGNRPFVSGSTDYDPGNKAPAYDHCSGSSLVEYYCNGDSLGINDRPCSDYDPKAYCSGSKCVMGECANASNCDDGNSCTNDSCLSYSCSHTNVSNGTFCGSGELCYSGSCIDECTETDGGNRPFYSGYTTFNGSSAYDNCSGNTLREYYCSSGMRSLSSLDCSVHDPSAYCNTNKCVVNPPSLSLSADSGSIDLNESVRLTWTVGENAISCIASSTDGDWSGAKTYSNGTYSNNVTPFSIGTKTYTLQCSNSQGTRTASVTVNVILAPVTCTDFSYTIDSGDTQSAFVSSADTNRWSAVCEDFSCDNFACEYESPTYTQNYGATPFSGTFGSNTSYTNTSGSDQTRKCTFTVWNSSDSTDTGTCTGSVTVRDESGSGTVRNVSFSRDPIDINLGESSTFTWSVEGFNSGYCTASTEKEGSGDWSGSKESSDGTYHQEVTPTSTGLKSYTLECLEADHIYIRIFNVNVYKAPPNDIPTAIIDQPLIDQTIGTDNIINFIGHGTDTDGSIEGYEWLMGDCNTGTSLTIEDIGDAGFNPLQSVLNYTFNTVGTYTVYFKVKDNKNAWSSCKSRIITVTDYSCTDIPNSTICPSDGTGLVGPVSSTVVADGDCSPPEGSDPKCEYTCNSPHVKVGNTCIIPTCIPGDDITNAELCSGDSPVSGSEFRDVVLSCSDPAGSDPKCEYTCNDGYRYDSDSDTCELIPTTRPVNWQEINP